jgi:preprotein translocase subunit YajC
VFISTAFAQTAAAGQAQPGVESFFTGMFPMILIMFAVLYFVSIRPQMKQQKEQQAMLNALKKGDEVIAAGGIVGRVVKVADNGYVTLEVAKDTEIIVQKSAVSTLLLTGTIKTL